MAKSNTLAPNAPNFSAVVGIVVLTAANFLLPSVITLLTNAWRRSYSVRDSAVLFNAAA